MKKKCISDKTGVFTNQKEIILWIMKKSFYFFVVFFNISVFGYTQNLSLNLGKVSLYESFKKIEEESNITLFYSDTDLDVDKLVTVKFRNKKPLDIVANLVGSDYTVKLIDNSILVISPNPKEINVVEQQTLVDINGIVKDENGIPLAGVNIIVKGDMNFSFQTDFDGKYSIKVPSNSVLVFSFLGLASQTIAIGSQKEINLIMKTESNQLQDIVINTGVTVRKKELFTGAVATIKGPELKMISTQNVIQAIKTLDPSFLVIDNVLTGSNPNVLPTIEMRGKTSISQQNLNSQFDKNPNQPIFILDGFETDLQTIVDLDMNRIQSITLLKDAASTALYGSRAANGVFVVETKKPIAGKLQVFYTNDSRFEEADLSVYNLMNAEQKLEFERLSNVYHSDFDPARQLELDQIYSSRLMNVRSGVNTYWLNEPITVGVTSAHSLNVGGGTDEFRYSLGLNMKTIDGVMKGTENNTWGYSIDLMYHKNKLALSNKLYINGGNEKDSPYGSFSDFAKATPYFPKRNPDGSVNRYLNGTDDATTLFLPNQVNPLYNATLSNFTQRKAFDFLNNFGATYSFNSGIRAEMGISVSRNTVAGNSFVDPRDTHFDTSIPLEKGLFTKSQLEANRWSVNLGASYVKVFGEKHTFSTNLRTEAEENKGDFFETQIFGFPEGVPADPIFAYGYKEGTRPNSQSNISRRNRFFTSTNYSYERKYLLDLTYSIDGTTTFGSSNHFAPFWGVGIGWNLHNEFNMDIDKVSLLKLRANIGTTGNQNVGLFSSNDIYNFIPNNNSFGTGLELTQLGNENLAWQQTKDLSLGVDFEMFAGKLSGYFNAYNKKTDPLVVPINSAPSTGVTSYPLNVGYLDVKGIEWKVNYSPIYNVEKNIYLSFAVFGSYIKSEYGGFNNTLSSLDETEKNNNSLVRYRDGYSPDDIWAVRSLGIDPTSGNEVYLKKNGEATFTYDPADIVKVGNKRPDVTGIASTNFAYKNFTVGVNIRYSFGAETFNNALYNKVENISGDAVYYNQDVRALYDRWTTPGQVAQFKRITDTSNTPLSSRFVQKEDYVTGESINFGYTVNDSNWMQKAGLTAMRFNAIFNDIFTTATIKAERGIDYPFTRAFSFSINLTF